MAPQDRVLALLDQLERTVRELKAELGARGRSVPVQEEMAVEAFADETFRARDA